MPYLSSEFNQDMMRRALHLAHKGINTTTPNPRVGCVLVDTNGHIVGEGFHEKAGQAHAEINALKQAGEKSVGASAYVTLEPCSHHGKTPPCCDALISAGVSRVFYAMQDPNPVVSGRGFKRLRAAGIEVHGPILTQEAHELNRGFIKRMTQGLPFVQLKSAMSLDGRTAMACGESKWITSELSRVDVQRIRARSCAIVTGVQTVIHDDPALTVRLGPNDRQPLRIVVDSAGRCPQTAKIHTQPGQTIIAGTKPPPNNSCANTLYWELPEHENRVDLHHLLRKLGQEGCNDVLVEAGSTLSGAFLSLGLVDEIVVYMAAKLMGSEAKHLFDLPIQQMSSAISLQITDMSAIGDDWRMTASVQQMR